MRGLDMKICCLKAGIVGCFWMMGGLAPRFELSLIVIK